METKLITYRIQQPEHSLDLLLDPSTQFSTSWNAENDIRAGVSACCSIEELASYFAQAGVCLSAECLLVEMECEWAEEEDLDAQLGAVLVIPTAIRSAVPVPDSFFALVGDAYDRIYA